MTLTLTTSNMLNGIGEFPPVSDHVYKSLFPKEDLDKGGEDQLENVKTAAYKRLLGEIRDIDGFDLEIGSLTTDQQEIFQAAWAHLVMHILWTQGILHPDDISSKRAKYHLDNYTRIRARVVYTLASGRTTYSGSGGRLVRA